MKVAVLILLCAREAALAAPNNFISSNQCQELSSILRSVRKGQQSVSTAINFLHDQKISAQGKACTGASCEGYDCCRCCCYSKCCSPQQWAKDLGIKASLSGVATKKRCTCANGTPAAGASCPANGGESCSKCNSGFVLDRSHGGSVCSSPPSDGYGWTKVSRKHCVDQHGVQAYHSLHAAKQACASTNPPCRAVYDDKCDGQGNFYLCNRDATLISSTINSCVYESTRPYTNKPCTCANGTPAAGTSCPANGGESCSKCNSGFVLDRSHGGSVCSSPPSDGYGWTKISQKHCGSQHGVTAYHSLNAAKQACVSTNPPCRAVYDSQCDGRGNFYLCNRDATLQSSSVHSCVYESTRPHTNKPCTCANGTPAAGASCPAKGGEACVRCNAGFHIHKMSGYDVCRRTSTLAPSSCAHPKYSARTSAFVTSDGHTCSATAVHHHHVDSLAACQALCSADRHCHFVMWSFNYAGYCYTGGNCPKTQKRNNYLALFRKLPCGKCNDGFFLDPSQGSSACLVKQCTCASGDGATGISCPTNGGEACVRCNAGFHIHKMSGYDVCRRTSTLAPSSCAHPKYSARTAAFVTSAGHTCSATAVRHHDVGSLAACQALCSADPHCHFVMWSFRYDGYCYTGGNCPKTQKRNNNLALYRKLACGCKCTNGVAASSCANYADEACITCDDGFFLDPSQGACLVKQCTCANGVGAVGTSCPVDGNEECFSCNTGFSLNTAWGGSTCSGDVVVVHGRNLRVNVHE